MMMPPGFQPGRPQPSQVPFWQQPKPPAPRPAPKPPAAAQAPTPPAAAFAPKPPAVRAQMADEPRPTPKISLPSPEQLGVPVPMSWAEARVRLDRAGATGLTLDRDAAGYRFACKLPGGRSAEARAATEAEAVRLVLVQVEGK